MAEKGFGNKLRVHPTREVTSGYIWTDAASLTKNNDDIKIETLKNAVAGDRTRVARVTGGNTYHYTTTTSMEKTLISIFINKTQIQCLSQR